MKLSTSNTFDVATIAETKTYQEAKSFFDFVNSFVSEVVEGFRKKLTLRDNFNYNEKELTVTHGTPINLGVMPYTAIFMRSRQPILTYAIEQNNKSEAMLTVYFKVPHSIAAKSCLWQIGNTVKYEVLNANMYSVGERVAVTGFSNNVNNGEFIVAYVDNSSSTLYLLNPFRSDKTADEIKPSHVGKQSAQQKITIGVLN